MEYSGLEKKIREEKRNLGYEYFYPVNDDETVLLIDFHHTSPMMVEITKLCEKYDLHIRLERYVSDDANENIDRKFIRE